jgi:hypothetical protein
MHRNELECFFRISLIFAGQARAYPREPLIVRQPKGRFKPSPLVKTKEELTDVDKHSSFLRCGSNAA